MSNADGRLLVALATVAASIGSVACAALLHTAGSRNDAAWLVVVTTVWGLLTLVLARHSSVHHVGWLVLVALLVRIPLVGTPALLSDDLYRYVFEGIAMNQGHNPFLESPASLAGVADDIRLRVNHPTVTTLYPPLALWWFRLLGAAGTVWAAQLATALVDVGTPVAILIGSRRAWPAWVYALHPLPVIEAANGAHIDIVAVALAAWGVAAWRRGHPDAAWWAVAAAAATKLLPAALLPALWRRTRSPWLTGAATTLVVAVLAAPVSAAGSALLDGFRQYADMWAFNGFVFTWLEPVGGARRALVLVGAAVTGLALLRHRDPGVVWGIVGATFVLLSPTVHPWYLTWAMVPALLNGRWGWAAAGVPLLISYAVLTDLDVATGSWGDASWVWWVTWPPALACLIAANRRTTISRLGP